MHARRKRDTAREREVVPRSRYTRGMTVVSSRELGVNSPADSLSLRSVQLIPSPSDVHPLSRLCVLGYKSDWSLRRTTRAQKLCESRGGRPGLPVPNKPYGLCGRKATLNSRVSFQELCKRRDGRHGLQSLIVRTVSADVEQF